MGAGCFSASRSSIMPCVSSATFVSRMSHNEPNRPVGIEQVGGEAGEDAGGDASIEFRVGALRG